MRYYSECELNKLQDMLKAHPGIASDVKAMIGVYSTFRMFRQEHDLPMKKFEPIQHPRLRMPTNPATYLTVSEMCGTPNPLEESAHE